jgi:histidinol-phosphatase (PHP family)
VTLGSDAHQPERVADGYETAMTLLVEAGYTHVSLFLNRQRQEVSITDAMASLVSSPVAS